jgi:hypothetical protein
MRATAILVSVGLLTLSLTAVAPGAAAETTVPDKYPGECLPVYLFEAETPYVTVDASDTCATVTVQDEEACQDLADSNTLLLHEGECEFTVDDRYLTCPGPLCPGYPIE